MLSNLSRFFKELLLVQQLLPFPLYARWVLGAVKNWGVLVKTQSLAILDINLGSSFHIIFHGKKINFSHVDFGVVREIYGHLCYAQTGELKNAKHILDLGANGGAFTIFALTEAPQANVYAVEAQSEFINILEDNIQKNSYSDRAKIECAVVGGFYDDWTQSLAKLNPGVKEFNIYEYIQSVGICDFLKCDVEGGEFYLFRGDLSWTESVKKMALEFHPNQGDVDQLESKIKSQGFKVKRVDHRNLGYFYCERE